MALAEPQTGGCFATRRIGHVNLYITDYELSLRFYREVAGLCEGWVRPKIGGAFLSNGYTHHDIGFIPWGGAIAPESVTEPGLNHLAFEVETEADLVAGYHRAQAAGKDFPRTVDHLVAHSIYSRDPHGFGIEIYADKPVSYKDPEFEKLRRATEPWTPDEIPPSTLRNYPQDPQPRIDENAIFHTRHLSGAVIVSDDFDAAITYYGEAVGLSPIDGGPDQTYVTLGGSARARDLSILRADPENGLTPGFHHMNFAVFDETDLEASIEAAKSAGLAIEREIDHPSRRGAVVADPDGFRVLFHVDRDGVAHDVRDTSADDMVWLL